MAVSDLRHNIMKLSIYDTQPALRSRWEEEKVAYNRTTESSDCVVDSDLHIVSPIGQSPGELQPAITHIGLCRFSSLTSSNICPTSLLATPECEHTRAVAGGTAEAASFNAANSTGVSSSLACPSL